MTEREVAGCVKILGTLPEDGAERAAKRLVEAHPEDRTRFWMAAYVEAKVQAVLGQGAGLGLMTALAVFAGEDEEGAA